MKSREKIIEAAREVFKESGQSQIAEETFIHSLRDLLTEESAFIPSSNIGPVTDAPKLSGLEEYRTYGEEALSQLVVCKLNGGLGTSMGLEKAKSLLPVRDGASFLDLIIAQIQSQRERYGVALPFVAMNSFRTEEDALKRIPADFNGQSEVVVSMRQHRVPKIDASTMLPVSYSKDPSLEWCPPGHGDLYPVLVASGVLEEALRQGKRYLFVSNSDNLGATVSLELLGYLAKNEISFLMEAAERTVIDRKGGHLARTRDGQLILREKAQVSPEDETDFQDYQKYTMFNTNSLWIDLKALRELIEQQNGIVPLPVIRNEKRVDPRDSTSPKVIQLETAMGSALSLFHNSAAVVVPRTRFLPVKTTDDLLRVRSDLFSVNEGGELCASEEKLSFPISLDPDYFGKVDDFEARFPKGAPSLVNATSFTVRGDVVFGEGVVCKGVVELQNDGQKPLHVADGEVLDGS